MVSTTLRSPAQVEKVITPKELRALDLVEKPEGGFTLAPENSNLPAVGFDDFEILTDPLA